MSKMIYNHVNVVKLVLAMFIIVYAFVRSAGLLTVLLFKERSWEDKFNSSLLVASNLVTEQLPQRNHSVSLVQADLPIVPKLATRSTCGLRSCPNCACERVGEVNLSLKMSNSTCTVALDHVSELAIGIPVITRILLVTMFLAFFTKCLARLKHESLFVKFLLFIVDVSANVFTFFVSCMYMICGFALNRYLLLGNFVSPSSYTLAQLSLVAGMVIFEDSFKASSDIALIICVMAEIWQINTPYLCFFKICVCIFHVYHYSVLANGDERKFYLLSIVHFLYNCCAFYYVGNIFDLTLYASAFGAFDFEKQLQQEFKGSARSEKKERLKIQQEVRAELEGEQKPRGDKVPFGKFDKKRRKTNYVQVKDKTSKANKIRSEAAIKARAMIARAQSELEKLNDPRCVLVVNDATYCLSRGTSKAHPKEIRRMLDAPKPFVQSLAMKNNVPRRMHYDVDLGFYFVDRYYSRKQIHSELLPRIRDRKNGAKLLFCYDCLLICHELDRPHYLNLLFSFSKMIHDSKVYHKTKELYALESEEKQQIIKDDIKPLSISAKVFVPAFVQEQYEINIDSEIKSNILLSQNPEVRSALEVQDAFRTMLYDLSFVPPISSDLTDIESLRDADDEDSIYAPHCCLEEDLDFLLQGDYEQQMFKEKDSGTFDVPPHNDLVYLQFANFASSFVDGDFLKENSLLIDFITRLGTLYLSPTKGVFALQMGGFIACHLSKFEGASVYINMLLESVKSLFPSDHQQQMFGFEFDVEPNSPFAVALWDFLTTISVSSMLSALTIPFDGLLLVKFIRTVIGTIKKDIAVDAFFPKVMQFVKACYEAIVKAYYDNDYSLFKSPAPTVEDWKNDCQICLSDLNIRLDPSDVTKQAKLTSLIEKGKMPKTFPILMSESQRLERLVTLENMGKTITEGYPPAIKRSLQSSVDRMLSEISSEKFRLSATISSRCERPGGLWVGLSGTGGVGKTSLTKELIKAVRENLICLFMMCILCTIRQVPIFKIPL